MERSSCLCLVLLFRLGRAPGRDQPGTLAAGSVHAVDDRAHVRRRLVDRQHLHVLQLHQVRQDITALLLSKIPLFMMDIQQTPANWRETSLLGYSRNAGSTGGGVSRIFQKGRVKGEVTG